MTSFGTEGNGMVHPDVFECPAVGIRYDNNNAFRRYVVGWFRHVGRETVKCFFSTSGRSFMEIAGAAGC